MSGLSFELSKVTLVLCDNECHAGFFGRGLWGRLGFFARIDLWRILGWFFLIAALSRRRYRKAERQHQTDHYFIQYFHRFFTFSSRYNARSGKEGKCVRLASLQSQCQTRGFDA